MRGATHLTLCARLLQATASFMHLVTCQPELGLDFIRETALRLGCPSLPMPSPDAQDAETQEACPRACPDQASADGPGPSSMWADTVPEEGEPEEEVLYQGHEEEPQEQWQRERGPPEVPATPPSRSNGARGGPPTDATHSPLADDRLEILVPFETSQPSSSTHGIPCLE
jgi:hypothetical protein